MNQTTEPTAPAAISIRAATSLTTTTTATGTARGGRGPRSMTMKLFKKAIPFAAALALAGLLPAAAAQAQSRYGYGDRGYDYRYDRYGREQTTALVRQLAQEADRLRREAWSVNRRPNPVVARVLASLDRFDDAAERCARLATDRRYNRYDGYDRNDRYGRDDRYGRYGRGDYRSAWNTEMNNMLDAYGQVQDAVNDIRPQRYMAERLARIDSLVDQLTGGYDRYGRYGDRGGYGRGY